MGRDGNRRPRGSGKPRSFSQLAGVSAGKIERGCQVHAGELPLVDEHVPVNHGSPDIAGRGRVNQRRVGVVRRRLMRAPAADHDDIGPLADLDRADLGVEPQRAGAVPRGHRHRVSRGKPARAQADGLKHGRQPHLCEHVEPVVARRAISPQRDGDASLTQLDHGRQAGAEFEVRARAMQDLHVVAGDQRLRLVVHPHTVRGAEARRDQTR